MAGRRSTPAGSESVLQVLERSFRLLCAGPAPLAVDCRGLAGLPSRRVRLTELRELLLWPGRVGYPSRDAVWAELVRRARGGNDPAWTVAVAGMVLPGLRRTHARLCHRHPRLGEDVAAAMLAGLLARLRTVDADSGRLPAKLVWAAHRSGRRVCDDQDAWADRAGLPLGLLDAAVAPPTPWAHPDLLLAHAVAGGLITAAEAELVGRTRIDRTRLAQVAAEAGVSVGAMKMRRHRAERRLVAAIANGSLSRHGYWPTPGGEATGPADAVPDAVPDAGGDRGRAAAADRPRHGRTVTEAA